MQSSSIFNTILFINTLLQAYDEEVSYVEQTTSLLLEIFVLKKLQITKTHLMLVTHLMTKLH